MGTVELGYSLKRTIVTIVDADRVGDIVDALRVAVGGKGGALAISPVDDILLL